MEAAIQSVISDDSLKSHASFFLTLVFPLKNSSCPELPSPDSLFLTQITVIEWFEECKISRSRGLTSWRLYTRERWPLLTVETDVNGDSKSTNERGPYLVGSLGSSCRYKRFLFCLGWSSRPRTKNFCPHSRVWSNKESINWNLVTQFL
jgi:hypothetical protein